MRIPNHPLRYPLHTVRRFLVQPAFWALFFLSPWFNWFRVDMLQQQIVLLGKNYAFSNQTVWWLPIGFYGGVLLIAFVCVFYGRLFCGWACPHNTMTEWTRAFRGLVGRESLPKWLKGLSQKKPALKMPLIALSLAMAVGLTFVLATSLAGFVVPPAWILEQWSGGAPHIALVYGQALFTLIGLFLLYGGHDFCRTCCPYGMSQGASAYQAGKFRPMEIYYRGAPLTGALIESDCKSCTACRQVCPVDLDPRRPENLKVGLFDGCFNCGECIDACSYIHSFKQEKSLLTFALPRFSWPRRKQQSGIAKGAS
jgi:polyferredoxin